MLAVAAACVSAIAIALVSTATGGASGPTGHPDGTCGVCVLAPSGQSLNLTGNGNVTLSKGNVVVDSTGKPAVSLTGNGSLLAPSVGVAGTVSKTGKGAIQDLTTGILPIADPLAALSVPVLAVPNSVPSVNLSNGARTISPGVYQEIAVTGTGNLTLAPGSYVIRRRFTSTGNAQLTAQGVTLYLACSAYPTPCKTGEQGASLLLTGNGALHLSGPTEKCSPIAIFADRNSTASIGLTGNGYQSVGGIVYAKSGTVNLTGNGSTFVLGGFIVAGKVTTVGSGSIAVTDGFPLSEGLALSLSAYPTSAHIGETETLSGTLTCHGKPKANQPVTFTTSGANPHQSTATTNSYGQATFSYQGLTPGYDQATASFSGPGIGISSPPVTIQWSKARSLSIEKLQRVGASSYTKSELTAKLGDTIHYEVLAKNTGEVSLGLSHFSDPHCANIAGGVSTLAPGQTATWTCEYLLTEPGVHANVASVEANEGVGRRESNPVTVRANAASLSIEKLQKVGASGYTKSELSAKVGETVFYAVIVKNTGEVALNLSHFTDAGCTNLAGGATTVNPGASATWTCEHKLTEAGTYANVASVEGGECSGRKESVGKKESNQVLVKANKPATASLSIEKLEKVGTSGYTKSELSAKVGETVFYEVIVKNTGEVALNLAHFTDAGCTNLAGGATTLNPGASATWTCEHKLTAAGKYTNVATIEGNCVSKNIGTVTSNTVTTNVAAPTASLSIEKLQKIGSSAFTASELSAKVGEPVDYEIIVRNTGEVAESLSHFTDANCTNVAGGASTLAAGASTTWTCERKLTAAGKFTNSAGVEANEGVGVKASNTVTATVGKAKPTIATSVSEASVALGGSVTDKATLSGGSSPTGTVSWNVYAASDTTCKTPLNLTPLTASLSGGSATSPAFKAQSAGTYQFVASYEGDGGNEVAATKCPDTTEQFSVGKAKPTIATSVSEASVALGGSVTDQATVSGGSSPTGTVSWNVYAASDTTCKTPLNLTPLTASLSGGSATSPAFKAASAGTYQFVATYEGDSGNEAAATTCPDTSEQFTVGKAKPTIATSVSEASVALGGSVTDKATVSGGSSPAGTVSWNVYAASDTTCKTRLNGELKATLVSGSATSPAFKAQSAGTYQFVASYEGDGGNEAAATKCPDATEQFSVGKAKPTIATSVSEASVALGGSVTDKATVSGGSSPTGTVSWNVYAASDTTCKTPLNLTPLTASLSGGSATSPAFKAQSAGTYQFVASYEGDGGNEVAATKCPDATEQFSVGKAKPTIATSVSEASVALGGSVTDKATVSGGSSPTGTVSWNVYAASDTTCETPLNLTPLTASLSGGSATSPPFKAASAGTYQFVASYEGDGGNEAAATKCPDTTEQFSVGPTGASLTIEELQKLSTPGYTKAELTGTIGKTVFYEVLVTNNGNATVALSHFTDGNCTNVAGGASAVAAGETATWTCEHKLSEAGHYTNSASIEGNEGVGKPESNHVSVNTYAASLTLEKLQQVGGSAFTKTDLTGKAAPGLTSGSVFYVTERNNVGVAKLTGDSTGGAAVQERFVSDLPGVTGEQGPDSLVFDPSGRLVISNPEAGTISIADPATGAVLVPQINKTLIPNVADLAMQPGTDNVWAIGLENESIAEVSLTTGETTFMNPSGVRKLRGIAFAPTGRLFVSTQYGCTAGEACKVETNVVELDPATGSVIREVSPPSDAVSAGLLDAMSVDPTTGDLFVAGCEDEGEGSFPEGTFGLCDISLGTEAAPTLTVKAVFPVPREPQKVNAEGHLEGGRELIDGIAADGKGHVYLLHTPLFPSEYTVLYEYDLATGFSTPIAEVLTGDDVAPIVGPGAPSKGDTVNYKVVAKNTGEVPLSLSHFTDANCVNIAGGASKLEAGEATTWTCERELAEPGSYRNAASVEASAGVGRMESNPVIVKAVTAGLTLEKLQSVGTSNLTKAELTANVGETVNYKVVAKNGGEVALELAHFSDAGCTNLSGGASTLAPGASTTWTCEHTLTEAGKYTNIASVEANEGLGKRQTNQAIVQALAQVAPVFLAARPPETAPVDEPYSYTFRASGLPKPTFSVTSGKLPAGITLDPTTGHLSGTPTKVGESSFVVTASNGVNPAAESEPLRITVAPQPEAPTFLADMPPVMATEGSAYSGYTFEASGAPTPTFSIASGALPTGLALDEATGALSGEPTAAGSFSFTVRASNGVVPDALTSSITITVTAVTEAPQLTADNPPGTTVLGAAYTYTFKAAGKPAPTFSVASGTLPTGLSLNPSTGALSGKATENGSFSFKIRASNGVSPDATSPLLTIAAVPEFEAPAFLSDSPPVGATEGTPYSYTFAATGEPKPTFSLASGSLPPGLSLNPTSGQLSGEPAETGSFSFTLRAANGVSPEAITPTLTVVVSSPGSPTAQDHLYSVSEGRELVVPTPGVLIGDTSPATPLTALIEHDNAQGSVVLQPNGSLSYVPPPGFSGIDSFTYQVRDSKGHISEPATVSIEVMPGGPPTPTAGAISPSNGTTITGPTPITATLTPPSGQTIASWRVSYRRPDDPTLTQLATGTGASVKANFDPTLLRDGTYSIDIRAEASGGGILDSESGLIVEGSYKPGHYETTFEDMSVNAAGQPIKIQRTYDSSNKTQGDFGVGWNIDLTGFRVDTNGPLGAGGWTRTGCGFFESQSCYETSKPHVATITWPDGHVEKFDLTPAPGSGFFLANFTTAAFTAEPGSTSTLEPLEGELELLEGSFLEGGPLLGNEGIYDPLNFVLTAKSGTKFLLNRREGLLATRDANGDELTIDSTGIHSSRGQSAMFKRDSANRISEIVGPSGAIHYSYSPAGDLTEVKYPNGAAQTYTYDTKHDLESISGEGKPLRTLTYDSEGRLKAITDGDGFTSKISTKVSGHEEVVTDPEGKLTTVNTYDERGDLIQQDKTFGTKTVDTEASYDAFGHQLTSTDALGHKTVRTYDEAGDIVTEADPEEHARHNTYNALAEPLTETDPDGAVTRNTYNERGDLVKQVSPSGGVTNFTYNSSGQRLTETDPLGHVTHTTYDSAGFLSTVTGPEGERTEYTTDPNSGRITAVTNPDGATTKFGYDADGNLTEVKDALGNVSRLTYDAFDRLTSRTDPAKATIHYVYDNAGNLTEVQDRNGATTKYTYDKDSRLTGKAVPGGETSTYAYDPLGRVTEAEDATAKIAYAYDDAGHVLTEESTKSASSSQPKATFSYEYDPAGRPTSVIGPAGKTEYFYDPVGQLIALRDPSGGTFEFSFDPAGRLTKTLRPNSVNDTITYDPAGNLLKLHSSLFGETLVNQADYTYNAANQRTALTTAGGTANFTYDSAAQLTSAKYPSGSGIANEAYTYDPVGNRTSTATKYGPGDRLLEDGRSSYTYDEEGNLESRTVKATGATTSYTWSAEHQLTGINYPNGTNATLHYDPLGRLSEIKEGTETTRFAHQAEEVAAEYDGTNSLKASYQNASATPGHHLEMTRGGKHYYYLADGLGSTTALTSKEGETVASYKYNAFGGATKTGTLENPFTFTGQLYDENAGLQLFPLRGYEPGLGRFLSEDTLPHTNPYLYVANDPVDLIDPTGGQAITEKVIELGAKRIKKRFRKWEYDQSIAAVRARNCWAAVLYRVAYQAYENQPAEGYGLGFVFSFAEAKVFGENFDPGGGQKVATEAKQCGETLSRPLQGL